MNVIGHWYDSFGGPLMAVPIGVPRRISPKAFFALGFPFSVQGLPSLL